MLQGACRGQCPELEQAAGWSSDLTTSDHKNLNLHLDSCFPPEQGALYLRQYSRALVLVASKVGGAVQGGSRQLRWGCLLPVVCSGCLRVAG